MYSQKIWNAIWKKILPWDTTSCYPKNVYVDIRKSKNLNNYNDKKNINKTLIYFEIMSVVR